MISLDRNVDFRYPGNVPPLEKALADGTRIVRCISLPEQEQGASQFLAAGIRVIAVYTGESDNAGRYVMHNCSALQVGNEPEFAYPGDISAWPTGTADDLANVWSYVTQVLVPAVHPNGFPLIGPGFWCQDYAKWAQVAGRLEGISAAAVHVYPGPSGQTPSAVRSYLSKFRAVRPDLPLICTEYHLGDSWLAYARGIDTYCDARLWEGYQGANNMGDLEGNPAYGILALTGS